jgi:hypothetical protein
MARTVRERMQRSRVSKPVSSENNDFENNDFENNDFENSSKVADGWAEEQGGRGIRIRTRNKN